MQEKIIIGGFGGQGILLMGRALATAGVIDGKEACLVPTYGPEKRGGMADCSIILSDKPIPSPLVKVPNIVIVMNDICMTRFEPILASGGILFVNSSIIKAKSERKDITAYYIPCNEIAEKIGAPKSANIVMLGAYLKISNSVNVKTLLRAIEETMPKAQGSNEEALAKGAAAV